MRLEGKSALITAAGQGIGRATAEAFVREGAQVIAVDLDLSAVRSIEGAIGRRADVTSAADISALAEEFSEIDVLYNCAGIVHSGTILECDERDWCTAFDVNVTSMYRMIKLFLPGMMRRFKEENIRSSIVNMSSIASSIKGIQNRFVYGATKAAVIGLTKAIAADFAAHGVRCNAICPGTVETPSLLQRLRDSGDFDKAYAEFNARQAMGRLGRTEELAALAVYLASDESSFTTGQAHIIDGGWVN